MIEGPSSGRGGATVVVAAGDTLQEALEAAYVGRFSAVPRRGMVALLPAPPVGADLRLVVTSFGGWIDDVVRPRGPFGGLLHQEVWHAAKPGPGAQRFSDVLIPKPLFNRPRLLVGRGPRHENDPTPLDLLSAFAHPRQRLAARMAGDSAARAELAAPLKPDLVALAMLAPQPTVLLTDDLVAAELVAIALRPSGRDDPVPWQSPGVQRAVDLDLGVRSPRELRLVATDAIADALVRRIRPRIGLTDIGERAERLA